MSALSAQSIARLQSDLELLHVLYHRNKNQHRASKWWQWFATLRRHVTKLLVEAEAAGQSITEQRIDFLRMVVIPKCYVAFMGVVKGGRFAPLGLVLLGVLARVAAIVGVEVEVEEELEEEHVVDGVAEDISGAVDNSDIGVVISREEYAGLEGAGDDEEPETTQMAEQAAGWDISSSLPPGQEILPASNLPGKSEGVNEVRRATTPLAKSHEDRFEIEKVGKEKRKPGEIPEEGTEKKKKKRRKKGGEIDDLFSGLL